MERRIEFRSRGDVCRGVLRLPDGASGPVPLNVMAGGWCYTKEIVMPHYASHFVDAEVRVLLFDYRGFGESDGRPRQHVDPWGQVEDYKNALSFAATLPKVDADRIGVWGISYSGGHVLIAAATDFRPAWAISTIPVVEGFQTMRRCHGERRFQDLLQAIAEDRERRFAGEPSAMLAMSSADPYNELSSWPYPHVCEIFNDIKAREAPLHEHQNTVHSVELLLDYIVAPYCTRIVDTPVFMTIAKGDNITSADLEVEAFNAVACPNKTIDIVEGVSHMSLYSNRDHLARVGSAQANWLRGIIAAQ